MRQERAVVRRLRGFVMRRVPFMITCRALEEFIADWMEGTLSARERIVFDLHLRMCPDCRRYLAAYRLAIAAGQQVFAHEDAEPPPDVPEDLIAAVLAARRADEDR